MRLNQIDRLVDELFSNTWQQLSPNTAALSRTLESGVPGVYLLAYPDTGLDISNKMPKPTDIYYVGMTNSKHGLRGRLKGFVRSANGTSRQHSAGVRFLNKNNGRPYSASFRRRPIFYITHAIPCHTVKSESSAEDFYEMGNIACLEYYVIGRVKKLTDNVPPLNLSAGGKLTVD